MFAGSQLDMVIGLDIHMEMVPMPAPTPMPFPMPFIGQIEFKPIDVLVQAGMAKALSWAFDTPPTGPVLVNGFHGAKTGDDAKNSKTLPHFVVPPGTAWTPLPKPLKLTPKPPPPPPDSPAAPPGDAVLVTGSKTVYLEGCNATRLGTLAMSCSDPVRLPSSTLLAMPKGMPVLVGGPPAFDAAATAKAFFLRNKWTAGAFQEIAFAVAPGGRMRNLLSWAACELTGHPVDVATGRLLTRVEDARLDGPIPVVFERFYSSAWSERDSPLGYGWSHTLDERIWEERGKVVYKMGDGREVEFQCADLPGRRLREVNEGYAINRQEVFYPIDRLWLRRTEEGFRVRSADGLLRFFSRLPDDRTTWFLTRIEDREGFAVTFTYDSRNNLELVETHDGRWISLEHRDGRLLRVAMQVPESDGWYNRATFTYSNEGDLVEVTDSQRHSRKYRYDSHLLIQETDRDGISFWFEYDGRDAEASCVRTWGDDGQGSDRLYFREITYDKKNLVTMVEDSFGHVTTYKMNVVNAVVEIVDPLGGRTRYEYDDHLWRTVKIDPLGHATRHEFDARGNQTKRVLPNDGTFTMKYDADDRVVEMVDPRGGQWAWVYVDPADPYTSQPRIRVRRTPMGWARFAYEGNTTTIDVDGRVFIVERERGRIRKVTYPNGAFDERWYDRQGRLVKMRDNAGRVRRIAYDWESRVIQIAEPGAVVRQFRYSGEGDLVEYRDTLRHIAYGYRGYHRTAWCEEGGVRVEYRYTSEDDLIVVVNEAGELYSFTRDACGRVVEEIGFDGRKHTFLRDSTGLVTTIYQPSKNAQTLAYNELGLLTRTTYADGTEDSFTYDLLGALESATNTIGTVHFERDAGGRVVRESFNDQWVASGYERGARTQITSSLGLAERIERDAMNSVAAVGTFERQADGALRASWVVRFERDDLANEIGRTLPGGVTTRWSRDERGLPQSFAMMRGANSVSRTEYSWEGDSQLRDVARIGDGHTRFSHDARGRLVAAQAPDGGMQWRAPGPTGNLYKTPTRHDRRYGRGGVLLEADGTKCVYDADGNVTAKLERDGRAWAYAWGADGTLAKVTRPDGGEVTFAYDALKRRVAKTFGERTTSWTWDGQVPVHEVTGSGDSRDVTTWVFEPGTFAPIGKIGPDGEKHSVVTNYLGTPEQMVDAGGRIAWKAQLDLFGVAKVAHGTRNDCPWRWQGQYEDAESGLFYNRCRYYAPDLGTYVSQDPIRLGGGLGVYAYVPDPNWQIDPLGLAKNSCSSGDYEDTGGHHVHAKAAFRGDPNYDPAKAFALGQELMDNLGIDHDKITAEQRRLFDQLAASGAPNTMAAQSEIAIKSLIAGNATREQAQQWASDSLANLGAQGVSAPTRIPWH
jgi:RHS repeat-associated protein